MENLNENLTPDELIEKLKKKMEIDREAYSKIVENANEGEEFDLEETDELQELDVIEESDQEDGDVDSEIPYADSDEGELQILEEIPDELDEADESDVDSLYEADLELDTNTEAEAEATEHEPVVELEAETVQDDGDGIDDIEYIDENFDPRILQMLRELDDENFASTADFSVASDSKSAESIEATAVFDAANVKATIDTDKKPKVYRFRRDGENLEETKLNDAVADSDVQDGDMEKTKLNDIPELKKPDLVVMQTFGATVEHVRSLYGDDIADEYEKMIANSDFTERDAVEYEYTSPSQNNEIFYEFKRKMQKSKIKFYACAVLCALILVLENISLLGVELGGILSSSMYPVSYIMIDLQLLLLCGACAFSVIKRGVDEIFLLEPTARSVSAAMFFVAVIFNIISCFAGGTVVLYNFAAAMALLFSMRYGMVKLKRDYMTFKVLSSEKSKNAAVVGVGTSKDEEVSVYEALEEDEEVKIINLERGKFIKSFFARAKQVDSSSQDKIVLPLALAAMVVMFIISLVVKKDASFAFKVANMSFSVFLPFAVYFSLCYPMNKAALSVYESGAAIVGNAALEEYSGSSIISFEDRDVFPSYCVKLKSVKVYGNSSIDKVIYNTASVFSRVGGPLCDVFSLSTVETGSSDDVELVRVSDDGIEATVDGKRVLVGLPSFMSEYGINVRVDENDSEGVSRLYIAEGEELCAKFYIKYNLDVDFENVITRMTSIGICAVLKTFDPNINDKMLSSLIDTSKYPIRVIRGKIGECFVDVSDEIDCGIVSVNGAKSTVDAIVTCERLYNIRSSANNVKIVSMVIGMILSAFVAFFSLTPFASLIVVLYQLLWTIPSLVSGKLYL